ncbi:MAG: plasmid mobilization relaxosome protein MobC, partial [Pseudomonadota bacterium]
MNRKTKIKPPPPLSIRLTEAERASLEKAAGNKTLSAHIRECALGNAAQKRKSRHRNPVKDHESIARILGLLGKSRIANNLNQLAKDANCGVLVLDEDTNAKIEEAYAHIVSMRGELIRALGLVEES